MSTVFTKHTYFDQTGHPYDGCYYVTIRPEDVEDAPLCTETREQARQPDYVKRRDARRPRGSKGRHRNP